MNRFLSIIFIMLLYTGCKKKGEVFTVLESNETGIDFKNTILETEDLNILDYLYFYNGGGVAIGDVDQDGLPDIFFSGNQVKNRLYRNKGEMRFEDITESAGVDGNSSWNTGAVMGDVNGDGWLDIYVCAVVGINGFDGHNELFINNQDGTFTEKSAEYGLDFDSYSSSAAFLDYDLDGDLDLYLLNHAVHTSESYGKAEVRHKRNYETGDKLLENRNGKFIDISEQAGIYGGINGYGLGLAISDFNVDGYPDIFVGNDFHEDDYYYLNNGNGTFTESLKKYFGHTGRFSMGNDVADVNGDGLPDLISLDMLPKDEIPLKTSEGDDNVQIQKMRIEKFGYHYQFSRNMLFINQPDGNFVETALMSNVAATDWSWSSLFGDFDQDGEQDIFIANGIPKRPNNLDFIKFVSNDQIRKKINNTKLIDKEAMDMMPGGEVPNYFFKGKKGVGFQDVSDNWSTKAPSLSGASAYADLDGDGDLDLVTNNLNATPTIYKNDTNEKNSFLKIAFKRSDANKFAIGTKVYAYNKGSVQSKELFPCRGFQASSEPMLHFGFGAFQKIDSLRVVWPDKTYQTLYNVNTDQHLVISPKNAKPFDHSRENKRNSPYFKKVEGNLGIDFAHEEDAYLDFNREKLIPYRISDRGPAVAFGDLNNDGQKDVLLGGSKFKTAEAYFLLDSVFMKRKIPSIAKDSIKETIAIVISDFTNNNKNDVIIGNGGGDFYGKSKPLTESFYVQTDSTFKSMDFPEIFQNTSVVKACDYDDDGDLDVFVGGHTETAKFGKSVPSFLLENNNGKFSINQSFDLVKGMVTDAVWSDFDNDGSKDLIIVGEWMRPLFLKNDKGTFKIVETPNISGLWQCIRPFDIDEDGDMDYLLGNWGTNTKYKATLKTPLRMYFSDFDENGQTETIVAHYKNGTYYTTEGLDGLASQMESLRKKYTSYSAFAGTPLDKIFGKEQLDNAKILEVNTMESGFLRNDKGNYSFVPFTEMLQVAPIMDFEIFDFDNDGKEEALAGGNYFGVKPYHGRFDSFPGALLNNENDIILGNRLGLDFSKKSIRHLEVLDVNNKKYMFVVYNNEPADVYELLLH